MNNPRRQVYTCFPEGKHKVLTMSYDDGQKFDRRLVAIFNKYGIKGTFHLNGGLFENEERIDLDEVKSLYAGHEVSCHTYTHPTIARCPLTRVAQEIIEDRRVLEKACGYPVRGLSYPNGSYSKEIKKMLPACGIEYSRTVVSTGSFAMPEDFLEWNATCHHSRGLMEKAREFAELHKQQYLYMMYVWGHSYEFDRNDCWELMEEFCEFIGGRDDIWYATNIEIVDYMKSADRLKYSADLDMVYNPNAISIWIALHDTDRHEIYEIKPGATKTL